ncbi:unnamed protein product [Leuciscus chuanchicus]
MSGQVNGERGTIISPSDVKECLPAVGLGLRVVLTCNNRWMEGGKRERKMSQRVCCASFSVSLEHGLLQHNCTKHVGKQAGMPTVSDVPAVPAVPAVTPWITLQ